MSNGDNLFEKIFVYYKIVTPEFLKSSSESACQHSSSYSRGLHYDELDSSYSDFMCTLVDYKNSLSVSEVLVNISHVLCHSKSVMFTKVLVPLDSLYPYPVNLDALPKESNSAPSFSSKSVIDQFDTSTSLLNEHTNDLNRNNPNLAESSKSFNISNLSKNLKIDSLMSRFSSLRCAEERKHTQFVWVYANLDEPIRIFDNKIYIKVYLSNKFDHRFHDNRTSTANVTSTTTKFDTGIDRVISSSKAKPKSKVVIDYPKVLPSDRDEINDMIDKWSLTSDGKLKDIRSLLSTLQNVLLDDVVWEPMPLSLLVGDKDSIKKYYKKALLTFHPDKVGSKSPKNRLLSELIIQTLIKSWNGTT